MTTRELATMIVLATTAIAEAQPAPDDNSAPATPPKVVHVGARTAIHSDADPGSPVSYLADPDDSLVVRDVQGDWTLVETTRGKGWVLTAQLEAAPTAQPHDPDVATPEPAPKPPKPPRKPDPRIGMPQLITTPTGWLLPAAVLYSRTGLDTGGGVTSDNRVGLGDVAEFGISTLDQIRAVKSGNDPNAPSGRIQPYVAATFRMGVAEDRLFDNQPGLVLGFRKSFERTSDNVKTRVAELTVVASKHLGSRAAIHLGGAFWDASLDNGTAPPVALHDHSNGFSWTDQIRAFGGIQVTPIEKSEIMIDLGWAPEFCYQCASSQQIRLRPELAWGVRYRVADWMNLESGVRVPDIGNANLLDAQIFGQVTFVTWGLRHAVDDIK